MEPGTPSMLRDDQPLALFMEGAMLEAAGKMGFGVLRYSPKPISCVIDSVHAGKDAADVTGIPRSAPIVASLEEARALGAEALVLGIAPPGGLIPAEWLPMIDRAVELGFSIVNGLHTHLTGRYPNLNPGQWIWDIRIEPEGLGVNTGYAATLPNKRILMIGTDMAIGKMTAGLELWAGARKAGINAEFIATGQIGIVITGAGVPLDAIRVDFASGSIEREIRRSTDAEWIIVEGQGALCHPGSTANLPLLRGTMPTHLVLCHRANQTHLLRYPDVPIPPLREYCKLYEDLGAACGTFPRPATIGVCLNTFGLTDEDASHAAEKLEEETGYPVTDPVRFGVQRLINLIREA